MSIAQGLLAEWDHEAVGTRKALSRVPDGKADFKPHERSFALGPLAMHIATIPMWGTTTATGDSFDFNPPGGEMWRMPEYATTASMVATFDDGAEQFKSALAAVTDEQMMRPWSLLNGGEAMFTMPKIVVIRSFIFNHLVHHRGQLTVYLRLLEVPVPALYGPSADEQS